MDCGGKRIEKRKEGGGGGGKTGEVDARGGGRWKVEGQKMEEEEGKRETEGGRRMEVRKGKGIEEEARWREREEHGERVKKG